MSWGICRTHILICKFEVKRIFLALGLYISRAMQPLSLVEEKNLREEAKAKLIKELEGVKQVALTTDCWTSINNEGYMTVAVHYISDKLKIVSRVLNTIMIEESHTAVNLAMELRKIATERNLMNKILAVVTDNAANIVKQDVSTRWNSSYIMIKSILTLKDAVDGALKAMDKPEL
ncbi:putative zinc finger BED domain-containing protein 1-like [Daphnia sinensis]|uniref:Zinc finger BED domain-containing protein 1-like n=1 Tax=Daphnia sinensis TaxID=1820382 RepID=A0AAD5KS83_9CRUS|nr:putative zinc finger BED domain-containing protein 1-like [Daphnia sinensis]